MKHSISIFSSALCVILAGATAAQAMPTGAPLWGITGTGILPNTQTVPEQQTEIGLGYEDVDPQAGGSVRFFPAATASRGFKRAEVGAGYLRERLRDPFLGTDLNTNYWTVHGKYRVYEKPNSRLAAAVGAHYLNFGRVSGDVLSVYAVASKTLTRPGARLSVVGNAGALYQRISGANDDNNVRPYASLEAARNSYSLAVDYAPSSGQSVKLLSVAARYQKERLGFQVGYGQFRSSDDKIFVGASYRFGGGR
jgi:hypothetical protein